MFVLLSLFGCLSPLTDLPKCLLRPAEPMLQKLLSFVLGFLVIGHLFFRPHLKQLGKRIDRVVTVLAVVIFVTWVCQLAYLFVTRL